MEKRCLQHYLKSKQKGIVYTGRRKSFRWKDEKMIPRNSREYEMIMNAIKDNFYSK